VRRLTARGRLARLREERGGIAVMLALLMPILFGAAAIGIDTAAVWSARQQVQSGADAAVLAVATDCARGACGNIKKTAEDAFWANDEAAKHSNLGPGEGWISANTGTRKVSATQKKDWLVNHFFAGALGYDTGELSVSSYARWAPTSEARVEIPLAISYCAYQSLAGSLGSKTPVELAEVTPSPGGGCTAPDGRSLNGGISLFAADAGSCATRTRLDNSYQLTLGSLAGGCTNAYLATLIGRDVTIPVWAEEVGTTFRVYGYAAFRVTGFSLTAGDRKLQGYFTRSARQVDATTPPETPAPDLGANDVFLTEN
jgi:Putative Flp pilus-assembly TadE/G-like